MTAISTAALLDSRQLERITHARALAKSGTARAIRTQTQTSLSEVAGACGVDTATVWRWETGVRSPRGEAAVRYAAVLDMLARAA